MRACPAPTWLTLCTHTGEGNCGKTCERVSPKRHALVKITNGRCKPGFWLETGLGKKHLRHSATIPAKKNRPGRSRPTFRRRTADRPPCPAIEPQRSAIGSNP